MLDLNLINGTLNIIENPGLDTLDPRFQDLAASVQNDDFTTLGTQAEDLFREDIFDIRIIGYYFYALFLEKGIEAIDDTFSILISILRDNWEAVGPTKKKEKHTQRSLKWFFTRLQKTLDRAREKSDESWNNWIESTSTEKIQSIMDNIDSFRSVLSSIVEDPSGNIEQLTKLKEWVNQFYSVVYEFEESQKPQEEIVEEEEVVEETKERASEGGETFNFDGSYELGFLMKKIEAFQELVSKGEHLKASIIADDINEIVNNFDPRIYLPKVFAGFYGTLSETIEEIGMCWDESRDTLVWETLKNHYKTDLDGFKK